MNATEFTALKTAQIQKLAAKGRAWIEAQAKEATAALNRQRVEGRKDGTVACIESELNDLRRAWKLAK